MAIVNPNEWTSQYVRNNEETCVEILKRLAGALQDCVAEKDYRLALQCCDGICNGFSLMAGMNPNAYAPMLYAYSFVLAELCLFGVGGSAGMRAAIPPLEDALDFAKDCAKPGRRTAERAKKDAIKIENMLRDLRNGYSVEQIRRTYCPDFPNDIIDGI